MSVITNFGEGRYFASQVFEIFDLCKPFPRLLLERRRKNREIILKGVLF